jgi:hypothetical protein
MQALPQQEVGLTDFALTHYSQNSGALEDKN